MKSILKRCFLFVSKQDYTILVLRKSMFSREERTRMIAAKGLLDLIIADKQPRVHMNHNFESECAPRCMHVLKESSGEGFCGLRKCVVAILCGSLAVLDQACREREEARGGGRLISSGHHLEGGGVCILREKTPQ